MSRNYNTNNSRDLAEVRAHLDQIGIELYNGTRIVDLQITHVAGIGIVFGWPTWRSPGHRKQDLERHVKKLGKLESARHEPIWIRDKTNLASTRKLYGIKWVDKVGWNPCSANEQAHTMTNGIEHIHLGKDIQPRIPQHFEQATYSRVLVIEVVNEEESIVCFIDYGDCALIRNSELFELEPEYASIPLICRAFLLYELPLKLLPLPSKTIKKSLFNKPLYHHLMQWLESRLLNEVVEVVPTRDIQKGLSNGKIKSYCNEAKYFGVLLITLNGMNINDEFKREIERAREKFGSSQYDECSSEGSIPDDQLQYLLAEEDAKMLNSLSRVQDEHKPKRKEFLWKANKVEKLINFAQSVQDKFGISEHRETENLMERFEKIKWDIELLKQTLMSIECLNKCIKMKGPCIESNNTDILSQDIVEKFQIAQESLSAARDKLRKNIEDNHDLGELESYLLRQLKDLEALNDEWRESFGFIKAPSIAEGNILDNDFTLETAISMMQTWHIKQKQELRLLFDETKNCVKEFSKEQYALQKSRLRQTNPKNDIKTTNKTLYEYVKILDSETTISEANQSLEIRHQELRKKYQDAISLIKRESNLFEEFNTERTDLQSTLRNCVDKHLCKVGNKLEVLSTDLLYIFKQGGNN